jgi:hypothetical protein
MSLAQEPQAQMRSDPTPAETYQQWLDFQPLVGFASAGSRGTQIHERGSPANQSGRVMPGFIDDVHE